MVVGGVGDHRVGRVASLPVFVDSDSEVPEIKEKFAEFRMWKTQNVL